MLERLRNEKPATVEEVRGLGLWAGVQMFADVEPGAKPRAKEALKKGLVVKETHVTTLRLAPLLTISEEDLDLGIDILLEVLQ